MLVRCSLALLIALPVVGCTTTDQTDVAESERKADEQTTAAYDKADEKALAAENEADQKSEAAYDEAVKTEQKADKSVEETRQRQYVQALSERLERRKTDIKDLKAQVGRKQPAGALKAQLADLDLAAKAAEEALAATKAASWDQWKIPGQKAKAAFSKLDLDFVRVSQAAH